jgi:hypothetical protein
MSNQSESIRRVTDGVQVVSVSMSVMATPPRSKGGRRGKGPRRYFGLRLAEPLADELIRRADAAGVTINDYAASALAEALGLELPGDVDPAQQALPIAG